MDTTQQKDPAPEDYMEESELAMLQHGPMAPLVKAVRDQERILVALRNNRKVVGFVRAIDRHWNMIFESAVEIWFDSATRQRKSRKLGRVFLRVDNVVCACPNPTPPDD